MKKPIIILTITAMLVMLAAGCTTAGTPATSPVSPPASGTHDPSLQVPSKTVHEVPFTDPLLGDSSTIPVIISGPEWEIAAGCGWTEKNLSESAKILMSDCQARQLIRDGGKVAGISYSLNLNGDSCQSDMAGTTDGTCGFCGNAGPTLTIRYGNMTVQYLANLEHKTVTRFATDLPEGAGLASTGNADIVRFRNGTVFYTFNRTLDTASCGF